MGKWNYRRRWTPKNYYRDQRIPSPPTYYETEYKFRGAWKNADLPWEERFCISVGIPWEKIVNAKKYMNSYENVVNWNDSAGESTFSEAKKRFWDKINKIPTEDPQPDPNMYNEDIDWNPEIDLELVKELDRAYFNPDEAQRLETFNEGNNRKNDDLVPGCILGLEEINKVSENPWARSKNCNFNGWDSFNNSVNKNIDPWEQGITQDDKQIKNCGWGSGGGGVSGSWHKDHTCSGGGGGGGVSGSWHKNHTCGGGVSGSWHKDHTWGDGGANKPWERVDDISKNPWENNRNYQRNDANVGTSRGAQRGSYYGRGQYNGANNVNHQRQNGSNWDSKVGCQKRESSQQYTSSYKSARLQYDDYRARGSQYQR